MQVTFLAQFTQCQRLFLLYPLIVTIINFNLNQVGLLNKRIRLAKWHLRNLLWGAFFFSNMTWTPKTTHIEWSAHLKVRFALMCAALTSKGTTHMRVKSIWQGRRQGRKEFITHCDYTSKPTSKISTFFELYMHTLKWKNKQTKKYLHE